MKKNKLKNKQPKETKRKQKRHTSCTRPTEKLRTLSTRLHDRNFRSFLFSRPGRPRRYASPFGSVSRCMIAAPPPLSTSDTHSADIYHPLPTLSRLRAPPIIFMRGVLVMQRLESRFYCLEYCLYRLSTTPPAFSQRA